MIRALAYLIASVLVISVVRSIIGIIMKGFADLFHPPQGASVQKVPTMPAGGELKKDPVCGTFVSPSTSLRKSVGGETYYFCSAECRDLFRK